ncbi:MAG: response regulator transcription factor [Clostridia bacterium]|nr:response regulator transcription factor [Clostridia bacterium]
MNIAIVEDEAEERGRIREYLKEMEKTEGISFEIDEFSDGFTFVEQYRPKYSMIFLDIEMPKMNGYEAAKQIRTVDSDVVIIFVTNMAQMAIKGYEVEALDFIIKPFKKNEFQIKMKRALSRAARREGDLVQIHEGRDIMCFPISSIRYVDVDGRYAIYHTLNGNYSECITLKEVEKKINKSFFVKCNRCYLVNLKYVSSIQKEIVFVGKDQLIISRPQRKAFMDALADYVSGGGRND